MSGQVEPHTQYTGGDNTDAGCQSVDSVNEIEGIDKDYHDKSGEDYAHRIADFMNPHKSVEIGETNIG